MFMNYHIIEHKIEVRFIETLFETRNTSSLLWYSRRGANKFFKKFKLEHFYTLLNYVKNSGKQPNFTENWEKAILKNYIYFII